jgi:ribosomal protein L44E
MVAYCPYCKEDVTVRSELHEKEAMQLLKAQKRITVRHDGPEGIHVFRTGKATAK